MKAFIRRHSMLSYFVLTFAISWGGILLAAGPRGLPLTAEQFERIGPLVYLAMLAGPSVAGILVTGILNGKAGLRALLSSLRKWRVGARWYAVTLLTAPLLYMAVFLALSLFSPEFIPLLFTTNDRMTLLLTSVGAGLVVGSFEEIGWTGFAVPRLRQRYALLVTGIVMGMVWGAWHSLVFWESDTFAGVLPLALLLVRLFAWLPAYRVLMTWVYNHTESLFVAILMHGSLVASQFIFSPRTLAGTTALVSLLVWAAVLWGTVAVIMLTSRGHLSQQPLREQAV